MRASSSDHLLTCKDIKTGKAFVRIKLENLFFEISPLETVGWNRQQQKLLRAVWFIRNGNEFLMKLYFQTLPAGTLYSPEVMRIAFDPHEKRFRQIRETQFADVPTSILKAFLTIMLLLRELHDDWKILPFPVYVIDKHTYVVRGTNEAAAQLIRTTLGFFIVRESSSQAPYFVPGAYQEPVDCKLDSDLPFSQVSAFKIKEKFLAETVRCGRHIQIGPVAIGR